MISHTAYVQNKLKHTAAEVEKQRTKELQEKPKINKKISYSKQKVKRLEQKATAQQRTSSLKWLAMR